jgi:hypothetical protein
MHNIGGSIKGIKLSSFVSIEERAILNPINNAPNKMNDEIGLSSNRDHFV